jgi:hypothetical protein
MSDDLSPEEEAAYEAEMIIAEKLVAEAMLPYRKFLSAEKLEDMHDMLLGVLMTHPNATEYLANLAKRHPPEVSGEVGEGVEADAASGESAGRSGKK